MDGHNKSKVTCLKISDIQIEVKKNKKKLVKGKRSWECQTSMSREEIPKKIVVRTKHENLTHT